MQIGLLPTELWRHIDFTKWRPQRRKSTSGFWFGYVSHLERSRAIGIHNFDPIYQSTAEILLLPVAENKRPPYWNPTSGFDFDMFTLIGIRFSVCLQNFIGIGSSAAELWRHSDFQDGGRQPCWIWFRAIVAHPLSESRGLCFVLKFRHVHIYSLGDSAIFIFWHICLKLPIASPLLGGFGAYFSQMT